MANQHEFARTPPAPKRKRWVNWVRLFAKTCWAILLLCLLASLALYTVEPLRTPLLASVSENISAGIRGSIRISRAKPKLWGISDGEAEVRDANGTVLAIASGVDVSLDPWTLLSSAFGDEELFVHLTSVNLGHLDLNLDVTSAGELRIAEALEGSKPSTSGASPKIVAQDIQLKRAWVHGKDLGVPLDADIAELRAEFEVDDRLVARVRSAKITTRGLGAQNNLSGQFSGLFELKQTPQVPPATSGHDEAALASLRQKLDELERELRPIQAELSYAGDMGSARVDLAASVKRSQLDVRLKGVLPTGAELPFTRVTFPYETTLDFSGGGALDKMSGKLVATGGRSRVAVTSTLDCTETCLYSAQIRPSKVELSRFTNGFSEPIQFEGKLEAAEFQSLDSVRAQFELATRGVEFHSSRIPAITLKGKTSDGLLTIEGQAHEPGLPVEFSVELPLNLQGLAKIEMRTQTDALFSAPRIQQLVAPTPPPRLQGHLGVTGSYSFSDEKVHADVSATLTDVKFASISAARLNISGSMHGVLAAEKDFFVSASASTSKLRVGEATFETFEMKGRGQLPSLDVRFRTRAQLTRRAPINSYSGRTLITSLSPLKLRHSRLLVNDGDVTLSARAASFSSATQFQAEQLTITGPGKLTVEARVQPRNKSLSVRAEGFDIGRSSSLLLGPRTASAGVLNGSAEVSSNRANFIETADVNLDLRQASLDKYGPISLSLAGRVVRNQLSGTAKLRVEGAGKANITWNDIDVGRLLRANSGAERARAFGGNLKLEASAELGAALRPMDLPFHASGGAQIVASVTGAPGAAHPKVHFDLRTNNLTIRKTAPRRATGSISAATVQEAPWEIRGLDAHFTIRASATSKLDTATLSIVNGERTLATAELKADFGWTDLLKNPELHAKRLADRPFELSVNLDESQLSALPGSFLPAGLDSRLSGTISAGGTANAPRLKADLHFEDLTTELAYESLPITLDAQVSYEQGHATVKVRGQFDKKEVAHLELTMGKAGSPLSEGRGTLELSDLPLGCLPFVKDYAASGIMSGVSQLQFGTAEPLVHTSLMLSHLEVQEVQFEKLAISVNGSKTGAQIQAQLAQLEGHADASAVLDWRWTGITPEQVLLRTVNINAEEFELKPFLAFTNKAVSALEGKLSARVHANNEADKLITQGHIRLHDAAVQLPALGQRLENIEADLELSGQGQIALTRLTGDGYSGSFNAKGTGTFDTAGLKGLSVSLNLPKDAPMPITLEGVTLGDVWGSVDTRITRTEEGFDIEAGVPELHVMLPEHTDFAVQSLDRPQTISYGVFEDRNRFLAYPFTAKQEQARSDPSGTSTLTVELGKEVWLRRGQQARVAVTGKLAMWLGDRTRVEGTLSLGFGEIDVIGRKFMVDEGTIRFDGPDPSNPTIDASARWEASSGHVVLAEFRGPARSGKLTLRSEPPLSHSQILNLVLFDSPEGPEMDESSEGSGLAGGVASTIASTAISQAMSDLTNMEITAGVDTSSSDAPRPEVGVRLTPRLSIELQYNPGQLSLAEAPDRAMVSLDWRMNQAWSLETTVGDHGTTLMDVVWSHRY